MKDTSENREKRQRESYAEECQVWAHKNREAIASLKPKLFAIGGNKISPQPCPFVSEIASHGMLVDFSSQTSANGRKPLPSQCCQPLGAAEETQSAKSNRYRLCSERGWHVVLAHLGPGGATHILEATVVRLEYFGIPMDAENR